MNRRQRVVIHFTSFSSAKISEYFTIFVKLNEMKSALIFLSAVMIVMTSADPCGNSASDQYNLISCYAQQLENTVFNFGKLRVECVRESCPQLANPSVCPLNSDQSLNLAGVNQALVDINNCFKSISSICGIPIGDYSFPPFTVVFPLNTTSITICMKDGGARRYNLENSVFALGNYTLNPAFVTIQVTNPNVSYIGNVILNDRDVKQYDTNLNGSISLQYNIQVYLTTNPPPYYLFNPYFTSVIPPSASTDSYMDSYITKEFLKAIQEATVNRNFANLFGFFLATQLQYIIDSCPTQQP